METLVLRPWHFNDAAHEDIKRELVGLVLEQAVKNAQGVYGRWMTPPLRQALLTDPDSVRIEILEVRPAGYHPPSRPGWTRLDRVRWSLHHTRLIEVSWLPLNDSVNSEIARSG